VLEFLVSLYELLKVNKKYSDIVVYSYDLGSVDGVVLLKHTNKFLSILNNYNVVLDVIYRNSTFYEISISFIDNNLKKRILFRDFSKFTLIKFNSLVNIVLNKNYFKEIKRVPLKGYLIYP